MFHAVGISADNRKWCENLLGGRYWFASVRRFHCAFMANGEERILVAAITLC